MFNCAEWGAGAGGSLGSNCADVEEGGETGGSKRAD